MNLLKYIIYVCGYTKIASIGCYNVDLEKLNKPKLLLSKIAVQLQTNKK